MTASLAVLAFLTLQRLVELAIARRNTRKLLARGAKEAGAGHYPLMVAFHALFIVGLWYFAWNEPISLPWLIAFFLLQAARCWIIYSLGERWTTRIITLPSERLVIKGPYRYVRHPNYLIVAAEMLVVPMIFGLLWYAILASICNAIVLWIRIRAENEALGETAARLPLVDNS